jgi:hypothetical protein
MRSCQVGDEFPAIVRRNVALSEAVIELGIRLKVVIVASGRSDATV